VSRHACLFSIPRKKSQWVGRELFSFA
jgi:hypothetical protein